jgi:hypothetical protein
MTIMDNHKGSTMVIAVLGGIILVLVLIVFDFRITSVSVPVGPVGIGLEKQEEPTAIVEAPSNEYVDPPAEVDTQVEEAPEETYIPGAVVDPPGGTLVSSDSPVVVDDYLLTYGHDFYIGTSCINLGNFYVRNLSSRQRAFSYMYASVSLTDDLGNSYPIRSSDFAYELNTLNLEPSDNGEVAWGTSCGCNCFGTGFTYEGALAPQASALLLSFDQFGAFDGFVMEVKIR